MKLIIPMAGRGTRLRPHTHTTPKPLLPIAGKMMIQRIVETFVSTLDSKIEEIAFVLGDFGPSVEKRLTAMAEQFGARCSIYYQKQALGTAHAVYCARESLEGEIVVAFADTLFDVSGKVQTGDADSIIWLKEVENPSSFGVAVMEQGRITSFVEKPSEPISNHAIIGVYYFRKGEDLRTELTHIVENDIKSPRGEYELTDAIEALLEKGNVFRPATVENWLDCGTVQSWIDTTTAVLVSGKAESVTAQHQNSKIVPPVYIGDGVTIKNSTIGPNVSIEAGAVVEESTLTDTIVNAGGHVRQSVLTNSTIGEHAIASYINGEVHIGDHSKVLGLDS